MQIVTYPDQRLIRVGTNTAKEVVTMRWVQRANKGVGDSGYGKVYVGLNETLFSWEKIVFDDNWASISKGKRKEAIKQEWMNAFGEMDVAGVTKKRGATISEITSSPNKKFKLIDVNSIIRSWMRGGVLSSKYLERVGKDLRVRKSLKHAPSDVSPNIVFGFAKDNSRKEIAAEMERDRRAEELRLQKKYLHGDEDEESKVDESTLLKWLEIKPWNDRKVFNEYFVSKRPKKSKARTLKGERSAILSTSLRACVFPLRIDDTFDGKQLVEFSRAIENHTPMTLPPEESVHQKDTKQLWDRKEGARGRASEKMMRKRALPKILKARMKTVHPRCGEFMYGDQGAQDYSGLGLDLEEWESLTKEEAYIDMTAKESRKQLLKETEKDWHSTRVDKLIEQILSLHESKSEGKIIITDEFIQTLDVVSNALRATGIEFLEFNGHMSLKERDAVRERFHDPKDEVRVMLATIECFGLGLTLVEATNMFILTPR
ncbi:hypothetical protein J4E90_009872 [Alternaria incomplexa]|uniref:uncharacterized protein n=1 Tax=Alternaria incomplexa TaxID=1187928 RepID=UPI0022200936|nr:uncharacterized protein J4E90_009872 [Alternaria incomplexa]KAI4906979.1 hypothetical protein J4E90_009872 [Alternaria incomplexa]